MENNETMAVSAKKNTIHPLIANKKGFDALYKLGQRFRYRGRLYKKVNKHLSPNEEQGTIKQWFLYPELKIPAKNFEFFHDIMLNSLSELLNEIKNERDLFRQGLVREITQEDETISRINIILESYEKN